MLHCNRAPRLMLTLLLAVLDPISHTRADTLLMGTSDGPPYMIQGSKSGLDIDITRAVFTHLGYKLKVNFYPLSRAMRELQLKHIDLMTPSFADVPEGILVSDPHIEYWPSVISRKKISKINQLADIGQYRIATFQGAIGYFGDEFAKATRQSLGYIEHHDMSKLVSLLLQDKTDIVVLDYWIFHYYLSQMQLKDMVQEFVFHPLIPRVPAVVAFHDEMLRDQFNLGLAAIKADGTYAEIVSKYQRPDRVRPESVD